MKTWGSTLLSAVVLAGLSIPILAADKEGEKADPEAQFKKMDKDSDGKVTLEEFVGKKDGEKADKAKAAFAKLDKNSDGSLTLEEFKDRKKST